jgi:hypothetical protein
MPKRSTERPSVYTFVHNTNEYIKTEITGISWEQKDKWMKIEQDGTIWFLAKDKGGYAWDGCTPKFEFLDLLLGTPDGKLDYLTEKPMAYYASMIHDFFYQFKKEMPLSRKTADVLFRLVLWQANFRWTWTYYFFVRLFGGALFPGWITYKKIKPIEILECSWIKRAYESFKNSDMKEVQNHKFIRIGKSYPN